MIRRMRKHQFLLVSAMPLAAVVVFFVAPVPAKNDCRAVIDRFHDAYFSVENAFFEEPDDDFALYHRAMECIGLIES